MSSEVQIRVSEATSAERITAEVAGRSHTYLKQTPFLLAMLAIGLETNPQRARLLRMSDRVVADALKGGSVGGNFIANTMTGLAPYVDQLKRVGLELSMDTFFQARDDSDPAP